MVDIVGEAASISSSNSCTLFCQPSNGSSCTSFNLFYNHWVIRYSKLMIFFTQYAAMQVFHLMLLILTTDYSTLLFFDSSETEEKAFLNLIQTAEEYGKEVYSQVLNIWQQAWLESKDQV
jgi:hypothetical protein